MTSADPPPHTNRLSQATSPYLLQHAHNPVDWYPWGEEALARARAEDKPILLSIGYSACHWCHVMERESFEDEAIAAPHERAASCRIKVDREERPDLDDIYMAATLAMNQGQGGWPMTVFLTPEQEPFFAGTYFPPEDRCGRPGFSTLLTRLAELWQRGPRPPARAGRGAGRLPARERTHRARDHAVGEDELRLGARLSYDARLRRALRRLRRARPSSRPQPPCACCCACTAGSATPHALEMVHKTLDEMARGGMYDQVGGGFHRYSVDERWLVPHFEKMLYDNALLARAYLEGCQATGEPSYAAHRRARCSTTSCAR